VGPAAARGGPGAGPGVNASERQQIIVELAGLGAGLSPDDTYATDFERRSPHFDENINHCKLSLAEFACIIDGYYYMKKNKSVQPQVRIRLNDFVTTWNNNFLNNAPANVKKQIKKSILHMLLA
jgi:hypothetical protein